MTDPSFLDMVRHLSRIGISTPDVSIINAYEPSMFVPSASTPDENTVSYSIPYMQKEILLWKELNVIPKGTFPAPTPETLARAFSHILALKVAYQKGYERVLVLESTLALNQSTEAWSRAGITVQDVVSEVDAMSSESWDIVQLSFTNDPFLSGDADALARGELVVPKNPCTPALTYQGEELHVVLCSSRPDLCRNRRFMTLIMYVLM